MTKPNKTYPDIIERSLSASILHGYYDKYASRYSGGYPRIRNRERVLNNLYNLLKKIGDGKIHDETVIYIAESKAAIKDPTKARYALLVTKTKNRRIFAISLIYTKTREIEAISRIDKDEIVWSSDNMHNTKHFDRTQYYLGFIYMFTAENVRL